MTDNILLVSWCLRVDVIFNSPGVSQFVQLIIDTCRQPTRGFPFDNEAIEVTKLTENAKDSANQLRVSVALNFRSEVRGQEPQDVLSMVSSFENQSILNVSTEFDLKE